MKAEVGKEGNILGPLLTLGQLRENEEPPPSLAAQTNTLDTDGQIVQIRFGNTSPPDDHLRSNMLVGNVHGREYNTDGEDPFGNVEGDGGLDFRGPFVEDQEIDGGKSINGVDGNRYEKGYKHVSIGDIGEAVAGLEIVKLLQATVSLLLYLALASPEARRTHNIVPFLLGPDNGVTAPMAEAPHLVFWILCIQQQKEWILPFQKGKKQEASRRHRREEVKEGFLPPGPW